MGVPIPDPAPGIPIIDSALWTPIPITTPPHWGSRDPSRRSPFRGSLLSILAPLGVPLPPFSLPGISGVALPIPPLPAIPRVHPRSPSGGSGALAEAAEPRSGRDRGRGSGAGPAPSGRGGSPGLLLCRSRKAPERRFRQTPDPKHGDVNGLGMKRLALLPGPAPSPAQTVPSPSATHVSLEKGQPERARVEQRGCHAPHAPGQLSSVTRCSDTATRHLLFTYPEPLVNTNTHNQALLRSCFQYREDTEKFPWIAVLRKPQAPAGVSSLRGASQGPAGSGLAAPHAALAALLAGRVR